MDRAKVILHMMVSIDGKIEGYFAKENKNLYVTELGEVVNRIMKKSFPNWEMRMGPALIRHAFTWRRPM